MASPVATTSHSTVRIHDGVDQPLAGVHLEYSGQPELVDPVVTHLRLLGATAATSGRRTTEGCRLTLSGAEFEPVHARLGWGVGLTGEAAVQAVTGIMAVHGRRDGLPRGLAVDYAASAAAVLSVQGLLASLIGQLRGGPSVEVSCTAERAALLAVSQYLAAAGADEAEAVELAAGGPPFTSTDGVMFELETLDPGAWASFWRELGANKEEMRTGWRPFQFRYATACAPFPQSLHGLTARHTWSRIRAAAERSGAQVCALRTLAERSVEHDPGQAPWSLSPFTGPVRKRTASAANPTARHPLAGLTVIEAGRRIQAPLVAHLLGRLGAEVIRIEPPGGDPLRGMPPTCAGISARWLALNRGKSAVEADIKTEAGRRRVVELAAEADVFLHNWAPGKAATLGLDRPDLQLANPSLVYAYTSGWADRITDAPMGTDFMVQARTGLGEAARCADELPAPSLMTLLDVLGGLLGAEAVLAGLLLTVRTGGRGVQVDSSLLGAAEMLTAPALGRIRRGELGRRPAGFRRPLRTADGWVAPVEESTPALTEHGLDRLPTGEALELLAAQGVTAVPVVTDLRQLLDAAPQPAPRGAQAAGARAAVEPDAAAPVDAAGPRVPSSQIGRDDHGAPVVPDPWSFA
ncbi:CoA transferase [Streptomyces sp. NPDC006879]|uniref:CoA transferase n=1 Tax=Streptomyces sp. NPDC006879 TaxID=3364767 RepID=UPI0036C2F926